MACNGDDVEAAMLDLGEEEDEEVIGEEEVVDAEDSRAWEFAWESPEHENRGVYSIASVEPGVLYAAGGDEKVYELELTREAEISESTELVVGVIQPRSPPLDGVHTDSITKLAISSCGTYMACASCDGTVSVFDRSKGLKLVNKLDGSGEIEHICFADNSLALLGMCYDGTCYTWHALKGYVACYTGHKGRVAAGCFAKVPTRRDQITCLTAGADGLIHGWDPATGRSEFKIKVCYVDEDELADEEVPTGILCMAMHPEKAAALCGTVNGDVILVSFENLQVVKKYPHIDSSIEMVMWSPGVVRFDHMLAAVDGSGRVHCTNQSSTDTFWIMSQKLQDGPLAHIQWPEVQKLVVAGTGGFVTVLQPVTGTIVSKLFCDAATVTDLHVLDWKDLKCVAVGTEEGAVYLWQLDED